MNLCLTHLLLISGKPGASPIFDFEEVSESKCDFCRQERIDADTRAKENAAAFNEALIAIMTDEVDVDVDPAIKKRLNDCFRGN